MSKARPGLCLGVRLALPATQFAAVVWLVHRSEPERCRRLRAKIGEATRRPRPARRWRWPGPWAQSLLIAASASPQVLAAARIRTPTKPS